MYFYEILEKCDLEFIVQEFLLFCVDDPDIDIKATERAIRNTIKILNETEVIISNTNVLIIEEVENEEETYDAVHSFDTNEQEYYGIELNPWANTLGYIVDEKSLSSHGKERFAALVLWEMTWFGYDEVSIQEKVKSWFDEE